MLLIKSPAEFLFDIHSIVWGVLFYFLIVFYLFICGLAASQNENGRCVDFVRRGCGLCLGVKVRVRVMVRVSVRVRIGLGLGLG